jgi:uncharacterized protein
MGIVGTIFIVLFLGDFLWWWRADRVLRRMPRAKLWRLALGLFMAAQISGMALILLDRAVDIEFPLSKTWLAVTYIWHTLLLLPILLLWIPYSLAHGIVIGVRHFLQLRAARHPHPAPEPNAITRRDFARLLGTAVPALASLGSAAIALWQLQRFRIRRLEIALPQLPPALDGLTIAHVTDIHVGQFTHGGILERIVAATNELQVDLVLYTGDLINFALSDLDTGLSLVKQLHAKHGVFLCEGNHDLYSDAGEFRRRTRDAGVRLLVNEAATIDIRGVSVQMLGLRWGVRDADPHSMASRGDAAIERSMGELLPLRQAGAFPILLAHHPHAFDYAGDIPLTLSGHTHGGQLMVAPNVGFGPVMYRYWSGLYRKEDRALVVSNGTGNWFPLRSRAPAEIIHITLRRA